MADISYSISLRVDKENLSNLISVGSATAEMGQVGMQSQTLTLSTNAVSISTANLTSVGMAFLRNLSTATAATCQIGVEAGGSFVPLTALRAGEPAIFRLATGVDYKAVGGDGARLRIDVTEG